MRNLASPVGFVFLMAALAAQAQTKTIDVLIDLESDGQVTSFSNQDAWEGNVPIDPVAFAKGDEVLVRIRFDNGRALRLSDLGGTEKPTNSGLESTKLNFAFASTSANTWNIEGFFEYVGVSGDLLSNPTPFANAGSGRGLVSPSGAETNLTDTSFLYSGINIQLKFIHYEVTEGTGLFDRIGWSSAAEDVRIVSAPIEVHVDIKPNGEPNAVNPSAGGVLPVGIFTEADFDALVIDSSTVKFGPLKATPVREAKAEDIDADGNTDLILHFRNADTGIACGDSEATLSGETFGGQSIIGTDQIITVNCP